MPRALPFHQHHPIIRSRILAAAALALIALTGIVVSGSLSAHAQPVVAIQVGDIWFCSVSSADGVCDTTITAGDAVTWNWVGILPHTTTACSGSDFATCDAAQGWDSPVQSSGSFTHTFTTAGTFYYKCLVHPGPGTPFMRGKITVSPSPSPEASPQATPEAITPTPVDLQPTSVPTGGGAPPPDGNTPWPRALVAASGALLVASAAVLALRGRRG